MNFVNLDYDTYAKRSPFQLSGGQMRRAAIAGIIAMKPKYLVLDEPVAGLDPRGRDEILDQIEKLKKETGITVILVSHSMDDVAKYVDRIIVMNKGCVVFDDVPRNVFRHYEELETIGLAAPQAGIAKRFFVLMSDDNIKRVFINPEITKTSAETAAYEEGCLSIPGESESIVRPVKVSVTALNENGKRFTIEDADGLLARIIQHENDHLNGILYIDRGDKDFKESIIEKFKKKAEKAAKKAAEKAAKKASLEAKLAAKKHKGN